MKNDEMKSGENDRQNDLNRNDRDSRFLYVRLAEHMYEQILSRAFMLTSIASSYEQTLSRLSVSTVRHSSNGNSAINQRRLQVSALKERAFSNVADVNQR